MSRHEVLPEPVEFGKYKLLERIAQGRMGEVFKAKRSGVEGFEKVMVVKRLFPHLSSSESFVGAFVNEARLTVSLSHANIVQVLDLGQNEGAYYMAMEHVAGFDLGTIHRILRTMGKPFPLDIAVFVISEVAKGLDYAHRRKDYNFESLNIVHRDLSPPNVLISYEGEVKLTDFGISRALEVVGTANDNLRRRYLYASPEQARGEALNHRSDIFSLGLILYELVSGLHPYDDPDPRQVQRRAAEGAITPVRQVVELPRALEQIINSSLVADPNQRVDSAGTLYEELISYLFASGHKADSRSLSLFMQEVKQLDEDSRSAPMAAVVPEGVAEELDFEEIDLEEIEEVEAQAPDLWELGQQPGAPIPRSVSGVVARITGESPALQQGGVTSTEIPARRAAFSGRGAPESRFDPVSQPDAMPQRLSALADGLQGGHGGTVVLQGQLGAGQDYLPDRLPSRMSARGLFEVLHLSLDPDAALSPYRLATEIIRYCTQLEPGKQYVNTWALPDERHQRGNVEARLQARHMDPMSVQVALGLCGLGSAPALGLYSRHELVSQLTMDLVGELCSHSPLVLMIDGVEHLDALSVELLVQLVRYSKEAALLIVLSSQQEPDLVSWLTPPVGNPLPLEVVQGQQPGAAPEEEGLLRSMDPLGKRALVALTVADAPLPVSLLGALLGLEGEALEALVASLRQSGAVRCLAPDHLTLASQGLRSILLDELAVGALGGASAVAARLLEITWGACATWSSLWVPTRVRLLAWSGQRPQAMDMALRYGDFLEREGWRQVALQLYQQWGDFLARTDLGGPGEQLELRCQVARAALNGLLLDMAREALSDCEALVQSSRREHTLWRVRAYQAALALVEAPQALHPEGLRHLAMQAQEARASEAYAQAMLVLGRWQAEYGDLLEAQRALESCAHAAQRCELHPLLQGQALASLIRVRAQRGHTAAAATDLARLEALARHCGGALLQAHCVYGRAWVEHASGDHASALESAQRAQDMARDHDHVELALESSLLLALVALAQHDAQRLLDFSQYLALVAEQYQHGWLAQRGRSLEELGQVLTASGDGALDALRGLHDALHQVEAQSHDPRQLLEVHTRLYHALRHVGSNLDADKHRKEAHQWAAHVHAEGICSLLEA